MINRKDVTFDCPVSIVSVKYSSYAPQNQIVDMLADFIRLDETAHVQAFTVKTVSVARYDSRHVARLAKIAKGEVSESKW
jgi:hypothetical protein